MCSVVRLELVELTDPLLVEYAKMCIRLYGMRTQRFSGGDGERWFALVVDGRICAVAWLHRPLIFRPIFERFNLDQSNSYFLRRVATCCPGDYAVELLRRLCERLGKEGKELLVVLGLADHSNALYRKAGFEEVGRTPRSGHPVFVKRLR